MRILAIRGANLASLAGDFEIELDQPPLDRAGLFAISGPTGAGKSTILDALCLALYDKVPRLQEASHAAVGRAEDDDTVRVAAKDVRGILRRGAGWGWAEVDFQGRDRRRWRARWEVRRARRRPDGRLQNQEMSLTDPATGELVGRTKTEVLTAIVERLGLDFDQFRRSVLLAQGEFSTFLRATGQTRAELLERMTGTELYGRISVAAHRRAKTEEDTLAGLEARLGEHRPLPQDARQDAVDRRDAAAAAVGRADHGLRQAEAAIEWYRKAAELDRGVAAADTAQKAAQQATDLAQPRRDELEAARAAERIRTEISTFDASQLAWTSAAAEIEKAEEALAAARTAVADAAEPLRLATEAHDAARAARNAARPEIERARALDVDLAGAGRELEVATAHEIELGTSHQQACERLEAIDARLGRAQADLEADQEWLRRHPEAEILHVRRESWTAALDVIERGRPELDHKEIELARVREALERLDHDLVNDLRNRLEEGRPCPVCGSVEHPAASEVQPAAVSSEAAEAGTGSLEDLHREASDLEGRRGRLEAETDRLRSDLEAARTTLGDLHSGGVTPSPNPVGMRPNWSDLASQWAARAASLATARDELAAADSARAAAMRDVEHAREGLVRAHEVADARRQAAMELSEARGRVLDAQPAAEVEARLEANVDNAKAAHDRAREAADLADRTLAAAVIRCEAAVARRDEVEREAKVAKDRLDAALEADRLELEEARRRLARGRAWLDREAAALNALDDERARAATVVDERRARRDEHLATAAPPVTRDEAEAACESVRREMESARATWAEAEAALQDDDRRRRRSAALAEEVDRQRARMLVWTRLRELVGSHDGSRFRSFAQSLTLEGLLAHANHHLEDLARRYRLERVPGTDLDLQVVDRELADEVRSVHSLSGGESFLVSLALALGLASLSSDRVEVESLFIDEGFGSLDAASLDLALSSLDALQALGRQVGVISHVPAMVERIGVRVRVETAGGGRSEIRVESAYMSEG
jgi:exonuclease SbcC